MPSALTGSGAGCIGGQAQTNAQWFVKHHRIVNMHSLRFASMLVSAISLSGCAASYKQPSEQEPSAQLITRHLTDSFPSSTKVDVYTSTDCSEQNNRGRIANIGRATDLFRTESKARIPVNARIYFGVEGWTQVDHTGRSYTNYTCTNLVSFIPEAGKTYTLTQKVFQGNSCTALLMENESGSAPSSFERHPVTRACQAKGI